MPSLSLINQNLGKGESLRVIAEVFSELATTKLEKIRRQIEDNRAFVTGLSETLHIVVRQAQTLKLTHTRTKQGRANLLLSSNHPLHGNLEKQLIQFFIAHSVLSLGTTFVIGKSARDYLTEISYPSDYQTIIFSDDLPNPSELDSLAKEIAPFEQVTVYHSKMTSVLVQTPTLTDISGTVSPNPTQPLDRYYIFEPEIPKMLVFFEDQIGKLLLEQTLLEAELARTAARLVIMDEAKDKAGKYLRDQQRLAAQERRTINNNKTLEMSLSFLNRKELLNKSKGGLE